MKCIICFILVPNWLCLAFPRWEGAKCGFLKLLPYTLVHWMLISRPRGLDAKTWSRPEKPEDIEFSRKTDWCVSPGRKWGHPPIHSWVVREEQLSPAHNRWSRSTCKTDKKDAQRDRLYRLRGGKYSWRQDLFEDQCGLPWLQRHSPLWSGSSRLDQGSHGARGLRLHSVTFRRVGSADHDQEHSHCKKEATPKEVPTTSYDVTGSSR